MKRQETKWYVAEVVVEITVAREKQNVVHFNLVLLRAENREKAYQKALRLSKAYQTSYLNPAGRLVRHYFRGIASLEEYMDFTPTDGSEITFREVVGLTQSQIKAVVKPKRELGIFLKQRGSVGPD